jgi:hypothetical protein
MPSKVYSAAVVGVEAFEVEIELHAGWSNTDKIAVVGPPDTAVKESKDLFTLAICNRGLRWPYGKRITINLAPAKPEGGTQLRFADCPWDVEAGKKQSPPCPRCLLHHR